MVSFSRASRRQCISVTSSRMPKGSGGYDADGASFNIKFIYKHSDKKTLEGSFKLDGTKKISFIKETILD